MTRSTVITAGLEYQVSDIPRRPTGMVTQAVVMAQLVDRLTGAPVAGSMAPVDAPAGLRGRVGGQGFAGLIGTPAVALPALATQPYDVRVTIDASGYVRRHERVVIPQNPGFPSSFVPVDLGVLPLQPEPVPLRVTAYELDAMNRPVPLAGATIRIKRSWTQVAQLGLPGSTQQFLAVPSGLSAPRPAGSIVDLPTLTVAPDVRSLVATASSGSTSIVVSNGGGLVSGQLLRIDAASSGWAEHVSIASVKAANDPLSPAAVELAFPLQRSHAEAVVVQHLAVGGAASPTPTVVAAWAADTTLALNPPAGLSLGQIVRVAGGASAPEFRAAQKYEAVTDVDGSCLLPPLTGLAVVELEASSVGLLATALVNLVGAARLVNLTLR